MVKDKESAFPGKFLTWDVDWCPSENSLASFAADHDLLATCVGISSSSSTVGIVAVTVAIMCGSSGLR